MGFPEPDHSKAADTSYEEMRLMSQTFDIIEHSAKDAHFAGSVKKVTVYAFATTHATFERRMSTSRLST